MLDWSETSQIVALLTENHGKVRGIAKGSKRLSPGSIARYSGGIELLTLGQAVGLIRPSSDLANLTEWDLQQPYRHLHENLGAQRIALYAADLINALMADHDPHPNVFAALVNLLGDTNDAALLRFQWRLLEDCGYRPQIDQDAQTGGAIEPQPSYVFDPRSGGLVANGQAATNGATGPWRVRHETVEALRGNNEDKASIDRANRLLCVYARAILDRQLPTMSILLNGE